MLNHCFKTRSYAKANLPAPEPIFAIIHGGGGVGKTDVIKAMAKWGEKILRSENQSIFQPRILLTSLTGKYNSISSKI